MPLTFQNSDEIPTKTLLSLSNSISISMRKISFYCCGKIKKSKRASEKIGRKINLCSTFNIYYIIFSTSGLFKVEMRMKLRDMNFIIELYDWT